MDRVEAVRDVPTCPIEPMRERVVVVPVPVARVTPGGIELPDESPRAKAARKVHEGRVAAVGDPRSPLKVGDRVVYRTLLGTQECVLGGVAWTLVSECDVLAKVA